MIKLNKIYPLNDEFIKELENYGEIHFFEEGIRNGGIAELTAAKLLEDGFAGKYKIHAVDDKFVPTAAVSEAIKNCGLDTESMIRLVAGDNNE